MNTKRVKDYVRNTMNKPEQAKAKEMEIQKNVLSRLGVAFSRDKKQDKTRQEMKKDGHWKDIATLESTMDVSSNGSEGAKIIREEAPTSENAALDEGSGVESIDDNPIEANEEDELKNEETQPADLDEGKGDETEEIILDAEEEAVVGAQS